MQARSGFLIVLLSLGLAALLLPDVIPRALAAFNAFPQSWTSGYEANPGATDDIGEGDDHMRAMKQEIQHPTPGPSEVLRFCVCVVIAVAVTIGLLVLASCRIIAL